MLTQRPTITLPTLSRRYRGADESLAEVTLPDGRSFVLTATADGVITLHAFDCLATLNVHGPRGHEAFGVDQIVVCLGGPKP